jgi:flagellar hook-length control protein FliK
VRATAEGARDTLAGDRHEVAGDRHEVASDRHEVASDRHEVTLRLDPPELGHLRLRAILDGDRLSLHFVVDGEPARQALSQVIPALREALEQQGLVAGQVAVDVGAGGTQGHASRQPTWPSPPSGPASEPVPRATAPRGGGAGDLHPGTIDVWA